MPDRERLDGVSDLFSHGAGGLQIALGQDDGKLLTTVTGRHVAAPLDAALQSRSNSL